MFGFMCRFQKWFMPISFCLSMSRSKVKGRSFRIYGTNDYVIIMVMSVTILGRYSTGVIQELVTMPK